MAIIHENLMDLIGSTPLLRLKNTERVYGLHAKLIAKLEFFNPAGSVKDRVARAMIIEAEKAGKLRKGSVIIEPTSGNTGIGLAAIAASRGYRVILTMPDSMSVERQSLLAAYGAEIVLTEGAKGMAGAIEKAMQLAAQTPNSYVPGQFTNPANPMAHKQTTGPEIWEQTCGKVDIFIAGVGTGGTITGVGEFLKFENPKIKVIAVEPAGSPILSTGRSGLHAIQGIGAGFIPGVLNTSIYDELITVTDDDAFAMSRVIARTEGLLVGISSGAVAAAAIQTAKRMDNKDKTVVAIFPDTGERYLSTPMFA